jgi:hypothetical protein
MKCSSRVQKLRTVLYRMLVVLVRVVTVQRLLCRVGATVGTVCRETTDVRDRMEGLTGSLNIQTLMPSTT